MVIDLDFLMTTEDYVLETESFQMRGVTYYPLEWTFFGANDPTMLLTWDAERDRISIRFEQYAVFLGTLEEHGIPEDGLVNGHPIVKLKTSLLSKFATEWMGTDRVNTDRGELSHYVIRTIEQEFHVLAYDDPTVLDLGKVGDTGVIVETIDEFS
ncbi:MAG: hypothetical protein F9K39_13710 [Exiguobacterium chiriqhucha]|uniref:hypothetical protein n=1 Tax=Exiguobacterium chiriqhucha TaxID=1385984 RepID=UPI0014505486|nr:hypothetical protein [Exiguobacterium chiriqhucha]KAB2861245.1 MAG: hypothetical protein F9K39_13710 [Exiguobacterium chiriqhucha]